MNHCSVMFTVLILAGCSQQQTARETESIPDYREQISVCEVHNVDLLEETVAPSSVTSIEFELEYENAMHSQFPHLGFPFDVDDADVIKVLINYCPACREANEMWHAEQQRSDP